MRIHHLALGVIGTTALVAPSAAQAALTPQPPAWDRVAALQADSRGDRALADAVRSTVLVPAVTSAKNGIAVRDASDGHLVYVRNGSTPIPPASTAKNRTAGAALGLLGAGYTWHTDVLARGTRTGSTLNGPLVIKGFGDPTLLQSDLASLAAKVRAAGITKVNGLLTDDTWFDSVRRNPGWLKSDYMTYYGAPISALSMSPDSDHDLATVVVSYGPGTVGGPARVRTVPAAAANYLTIVNKATTGSYGSGDSVWISQPLDSGTITVGGKVASGRSTQSVLKIAPSPQLYVGAVFRSELAKAGVTVTGSTNPGKARSTDTLVARDRSTTLASALKPFLKLSNNMMAETILKTISAQGGGGGTWADGTARVRGWMRSHGVPMTNVVVVDGSGLARTNRETAMSESGTLWALRNSTSFKAALPVAGNPDRMIGGTLRNRLVGTAAANNLRAKTGTLTGVTALSGYVTSANGRPLMMSMISQWTTSSPRYVENALGLTLARWNGSRTTSSLRTATSVSPSTGAATAPAVADPFTSTEWTKRTR